MTTYTIIFDNKDRVTQSEVLTEGTHIIKHGEFQVPIIVGKKDEVTLELVQSEGDLFDLDIPSLHLEQDAEEATAKRIDTEVVPAIELHPRVGDTVFSIIGSRRSDAYLAVKRLDRPPVKGERALDL